MKNLYKLLLAVVILPANLIAQNVQQGQVHGNFQTDIQYYQEDEDIGATEVPAKLGMNSFANIIYTNGNFEAGMRFETYQNALKGYDGRLDGTGLPHKYAKYTDDDFSVTVGDFYEQFGNGLIFRSYEDWSLGFDNAVRGIRVKTKPFDGVTIKGIYGNQRYFMEFNESIVRGADGEISLNELLPSMEEAKTKIMFGGSVISRFQELGENIIKDSIILDIPENVSAFSGRMNIIHGKINVLGEYAYKINDPNLSNNYIFKDGQAAFVSAGYSQKGLGFSVSAKRIDNFDFRSDRNASPIVNALNLNYLPALTKMHHYTLTAMYPYATQPNGEMALQAELIYKFDKKTALGGKYGTTVNVNYSRANTIKHEGIAVDSVNNAHFEGYNSDFFAIGDTLLYEDINIQIKKKFSKKLKGVFTYMNLAYNQDIIEGHPGAPMVYANIGAVDMTYKINTKNAIRGEAQYLSTKSDEGDWAYGLIEYSVAPKWFFSVMDQYNIGNEDKDRRFHYYTGSVVFVKNAHRVALSYGKQRRGLLCVGGVCREVPASNGITLTVSSRF